jgi:large subunit ribosomal protein L9
MQIILLERVQGLGQMGDEVKVTPGYARNFLLPRKKALRATAQNRNVFQAKRAQLEAENLQQKSEAEKVGEKLNGLSVILTRQAGEAGQLFGSVTARDIAISITQAGFTVNREQTAIGQPIKIIGVYPIAIKLHPEVTVTITANIARSEEEAKKQAAAIAAGRALGAMPPVTDADEPAPSRRRSSRAREDAGDADVTAAAETAPQAEATAKPKKTKKAKAGDEPSPEAAA